jgi:Na+:H+ antiporter, NhaA family
MPARRLTLNIIKHDAAPGGVLLSAALLALAASNSMFAGAYDALQDFQLTLGVAPLVLTKTVLHWVNDGLMAIFFFVVALEIKRELVGGALAHWQQAALPLFGAIGGMAVPACIYAAVNWQNGEALNGWAIASATDIAFAVGVLALLGRRVPLALRVFLLSLAILDDLGAIIIIAVFYATSLSPMALGLAAVGLLGLAALNRLHVVAWPAYLAVALFVWLCVLKSGVHATLAGVAAGLAVPLAGQKTADPSPLDTWKHALEPWVNFLILPVFAFLNAGVPLQGSSLSTILTPLPLGIALGLFIGKQLGIFAAAWLAIRTGLASLPPHVTWPQLYGVAILGGIGFTMSLFIGTLAFDHERYAAAIRIGVLLGSIASGIIGYVWLTQVLPRAPVKVPSVA